MSFLVSALPALFLTTAIVLFVVALDEIDMRHTDRARRKAHRRACMIAHGQPERPGQ